ncbi:DUF4254 domain-containing protein [Nocardia callitridis]|uniref:DUF4254 domain-containing protein n=1 Tax=Nocardia callitridis TaxID=648753 RepID=A0ABP9K0W3_9NOCA
MIPVFPPKNALLQACRGTITADHPLLHWAHQLTELHERKRAAPESTHPDVDRHRTTLITTIDHWITNNLPPTHGSAMIHTESAGTVIDRLANLTSHAYAALTSPHEQDLWKTWEHLAQLAIGYEDLATDVHTGRRRLPGAR